MKLTKENTKIKVKTSHLVTLLNYLQHLDEFKDDYLKPIFTKYASLIYIHNVNAMREKTAKLLFNNCIAPHLGIDKKITLSLTEGERLTLFHITSYYPLPMDINFIEFEIKNGLLN